VLPSSRRRPAESVGSAAPGAGSVFTQEQRHRVRGRAHTPFSRASRRQLRRRRPMARKAEGSEIVDAASSAAFDDGHDVVGFPQRPPDAHPRPMEPDGGLESANEVAHFGGKPGSEREFPPSPQAAPQTLSVQAADGADSAVSRENALSRGTRRRSDPQGVHASLRAERPAGRSDGPAALTAERVSRGVGAARPVGALEGAAEAGEIGSGVRGRGSGAGLLRPIRTPGRCRRKTPLSGHGVHRRTGVVSRVRATTTGNPVYGK